MELRYIGIDVSKDRLDVHILPEGTAFAVARDGKGLAELVERMSAVQPERIAVENKDGPIDRRFRAHFIGRPLFASPGRA